MSALSGHVEDYLRLRRALGYKLERAGHLLPQLVAYLEAAGAPTVTTTPESIRTKRVGRLLRCCSVGHVPETG